MLAETTTDLKINTHTVNCKTISSTFIKQYIILIKSERNVFELSEWVVNFISTVNSGRLKMFV